MAQARAGNLEAVEIHDVLSNERRRMVIDLLRRDDDEMSARDLSEQIAERETGQSPPPRNIRQSAYVSLHQTHLPKLDELGIIEYDEGEKLVALDEQAFRQVSVYMETVPKYGISWSEYYVGVSMLGLLLVAATQVGVPVIGSVEAYVWTSAVLALIAASATYRTIQQGSSLLHRLGSDGPDDDEADPDASDD